MYYYRQRLQLVQLITNSLNVMARLNLNSSEYHDTNTIELNLQSGTAKRIVLQKAQDPSLLQSAAHFIPWP